MRSTKLPSWIERLLGYDPVPVPPHVFQLERRLLRYGQFQRGGGGFRFRALRSVELPGDAFHGGPLGGPLRDPAAFRERLGGLIREVPGGVREASLVLPDAWLRVTFTEMGDLPKPRDARDEVLRWKLKRLVPFRVEELRVGAAEVTALRGQEEPRRLLLGFGVEQLLVQLEEAFAAHRVRLGQITSTSLALAGSLVAEPGERFTALVVVEEEGFALVFVRGGEPVLHRYKNFTSSLPEAARASLVSRDLKLTRNFLEESFPEASLGRVLLVAPPELEPLWLDRLAEGLGREAAPLDGRHLPPLQGEGTTAPWRELAPLLGAARQEVA